MHRVSILAVSEQAVEGQAHTCEDHSYASQNVVGDHKSCLV